MAVQGRDLRVAMHHNHTPQLGWGWRWEGGVGWGWGRLRTATSPSVTPSLPRPLAPPGHPLACPPRHPAPQKMKVQKVTDQGVPPQ